MVTQDWYMVMETAGTRSSWKDLRRYYAGGGDCRAGIREREEEVFGRFEKLFEFVTMAEEDNGKVRKKNFEKNELMAREDSGASFIHIFIELSFVFLHVIPVICILSLWIFGFCIVAFLFRTRVRLEL